MHYGRTDLLKTKIQVGDPIPVPILVRFIVLRIGLFAISYYAFVLYNQNPYLPIRVTIWYSLLLTGLFLIIPIQSAIAVRILAKRYQISRRIIILLFVFLLIVLLICLSLALIALLMNADLDFGPGLCDPMPDGSAPTNRIAVYEHIRFTPFEVLTEFRTECSCTRLC